GCAATLLSPANIAGTPAPTAVWTLPRSRPSADAMRPIVSGVSICMMSETRLIAMGLSPSLVLNVVVSLVRCPGPVDAGSRQQPGQTFSGVDHPGLDRVARRADVSRALVDFFVLVVDEIDPLPVLRRELRHASLEDRASIPPVHRNRRVIGRVF